MHVISSTAKTVSEALANGLQILTSPIAVEETSRNGPVFVARGPVITHTLNPLNRVLFCPLRNANPFFHLMEAMWMLAGRNDLPWLAQFNKQMASYSDDGGKTQPAAYGHRWRKHFGVDQLRMIIAELRANPGSRRAVLGMWSPLTDPATVAAGGADVPCNTNCFFTIRDGKLHMSVQCRSNDILWGAHGANAVHFSILQEYIAAHLSVGVGEMFQYSWNYHLYGNVLKYPAEEMVQSLRDTDYYVSEAVHATPLFTRENVELFDKELPVFMSGEPFRGHFAHPTINLASAMFWAWQMHKQRAYEAALSCLEDGTSYGPNCDWIVASAEWLHRKLEAMTDA